MGLYKYRALHFPFEPVTKEMVALRRSQTPRSGAAYLMGPKPSSPFIEPIVINVPLVSESVLCRLWYSPTACSCGWTWKLFCRRRKLIECDCDIDGELVL